MFNTARHQTKSILGYIHSNLWGSPNVPYSMSSAQYFIFFVDDFSRKVWVYFLNYKSEVFEKFKERKTLVEYSVLKGAA